MTEQGGRGQAEHLEACRRPVSKAVAARVRNGADRRSRRDVRPLETLFVGDHPEAAELLGFLEKQSGFRIEKAGCGDPALAALAGRRYDVVLLCACKPGAPGLRVLAEGLHLQSATPFIVLNDDGSPSTAVAAMQLGAWDYLVWPVDLELLTLQLDRIWEHVIATRSLDRLQQEQDALGCFGMVGLSSPMRRVYDLVHHVAPTSTTVLIIGETGTGKELVARSLHANSPRRLRPFVPINCAAVPDALIESELFGHVRGSFTGALSDRQGFLAAAADGTVFLDDVETLSLSMQGKLLRALEERRIQPVGARQEIPVNFRLVAATNADLGQMVACGEFREDLYYRLSVFPIVLPPLRERRDDIPVLIAHFIGFAARELEMDLPFVSAKLLDQLSAYDWPGNVRELRNWAERAVILARVTGVISLPAPQDANGGRPPSLYEHARQGWSLQQLTEEYVRTVLDYTGGHRTRAAEILGIDRRTVYRKVPAPPKSRRIPRSEPATS